MLCLILNYYFVTLIKVILSFNFGTEVCIQNRVSETLDIENFDH
jgi:hypothetical protein